MTPEKCIYSADLEHFSEKRSADCSGEMSERDAERTPERSTDSTCAGGTRWLFTPSAIWLYRYNNNYSIEVCGSLNHINIQ